MRLVNTFEGGTDGVGVSVANSGGASGDAFDGVTNGTGAVGAFDNAERMHGALSLKINTTTTSVLVYRTWTTSIGSGVTRAYIRHYWKGGLIAADRPIHRVRTAGGTASRFALSSTGQLRIINAAGTVVTTGSVTLDTTTWYRFECSHGTGTGVTQVARVYVGNSTAPLEEITATSDYSTGDINQVDFGQTVSATSVPSGWWDSIEVRDDGYPGPWMRTNAALGCG